MRLLAFRILAEAAVAPTKFDLHLTVSSPIRTDSSSVIADVHISDLWTTNPHHAHIAVLFCRQSDRSQRLEEFLAIKAESLTKFKVGCDESEPPEVRYGRKAKLVVETDRALTDVVLDGNCHLLQAKVLSF